jgi:serine/threonine protein kinase, bacterial
MVTLLKNRYRILSNLSRGGFGETFLAEDTHMPSARCCVIKKLIPIANDSQVYELVKERFGREAAILEKLGEKNPQIPSLYAYFEEAGHFYLVQEWIEGTTLTEKIRREGRLKENSVQEILISILSVLDYVHSYRIVHRDIKPDNIILRHWDGKPVLIDFGAVKETMGTVIATTGGTTHTIAIGTPGFMPSEQIAGRPVYASDLYSLGLTAIFLLTGKYPQEFLTDVETGEILWRQDAPDISPGLAKILDRAIHSYARDRFTSAAAMLDAIKEDVNALSLVTSNKIATSPAPGNLSSVSTAVVAPAKSKNNSDLSVSNSHSSGLKDWQKATIIGSIVGIFVMGGLIAHSLLGRRAEREIVYSSSSDTQVQPQEQDTPDPTPSPIVQPTQPNEPEVSNSPIAQPREPEVLDSPITQPTQPREPEVSNSPIAQPTEPETSTFPIKQPTQPSEPIIENPPIEPPSDRPLPEITEPPSNNEEQITAAIDEAEAAELIEDLYGWLSSKQFEKARSVYGGQLAKQFDPNFFEQFRRVTVNNLKVISRSDTSMSFIGENTYYYPDGSRQKEQRSFTIDAIDGALKVTDSKFIKVTKFR